MGFFAWVRGLFVLSPSLRHDDGERVPCAQCQRDKLPRDPVVQRTAPNVRGAAPDRRSASRPDAVSAHRSNSAGGDHAASNHAAAFGSADDVVLACESCGQTVACDRTEYDSARRCNAAILCPDCADRAARYREYATHYNRPDAPADNYYETVVPVVLDLSPVVVIDELPIVAVGADLGCGVIGGDLVDGAVGGADSFGGAGTTFDYGSPDTSDLSQS